MKIEKSKRKYEPFQEGSLAEIYKIFFGKLVIYKPETMSLQEWNEELFDVKNRDIAVMEATEAFRMPGLYYAAPLVKIQGIGFRDIPARAICFVRTDSRSDTIDVEVFAGPGKKDSVFALTTSEWNSIAAYLKPMVKKGRQHRREYYGGR
jgi:hypothetical protein